VRLSADSEAAPAVLGEVASSVDYVSVALGASSTYRGSTGIVPPPPVPENAIAGVTAPFGAGPPLVATSRIVDPVEADRLIADGRCDAAGMTRALITDPDLPRKAREGRLDDVLRCIGCNACIAHYHAGTPIACAQNPRTGRERSMGPGAHTAAAADRGRRRRAGRPCRAAEAGSAGHEVVLLERGGQTGGQVALAGAAPMHAELARSLGRNYRHLLEAANVETRLETEANPETITAVAPDAVVVATGARPHEPDLPLDGIEVVQALDVLRGPPRRGRRVVVADWGGDASGLACADLLEAAGNDVTVALGSAALGETLHQYQRNLYAARLYRAGVRLSHHLELVGADGGRVRFRNLFAPELESELSADLLVLALGRIPDRALVESVAGVGLEMHEAGDCLGARGLEEAILEGTLAGQSV
jgi:thioredoxin reductase